MAVVLVERGASLADCQSKIVQKYGIYFEIMMQRTIPKKFFGLIPESLEVEYVLQDSRMKMAAQSGGPGIPMRNPGEQTASAAPKNDSTIDFIEEKKRLLAAAGKDPDQVLQQVREDENSQQLIFDKLKEIQEKIETGKKEEKPEYPAFGQISQLMKLNDFSERYAAGILERMRKELPLDVLEDFSAVQDSVLAWIGESVKIYRMPETPKSKRI
ncbi:MAG: hypothetical protein LBI06_01365, partial [Treponema sp.]|nr:hypothetical protein [Treponema sp.]